MYVGCIRGAGPWQLQLFCFKAVSSQLSNYVLRLEIYAIHLFIYKPNDAHRKYCPTTAITFFQFNHHHCNIWLFLALWKLLINILCGYLDRHLINKAAQHLCNIIDVTMTLYKSQPCYRGHLFWHFSDLENQPISAMHFIFWTTNYSPNQTKPLHPWLWQGELLSQTAF